MKSGRKCYPSGNRRLFEIAGYALLILGVILLFASIPGWAWFALMGLALMAAGYLLLKLSQAWR